MNTRQKRDAIGMVVILVVAIVVAVAASLIASAVARGAMTDCIDATCRLEAADGSRGTGVVFEVSDRVYALTNAHVVGNAGTLAATFWRAGHESAPMTCRVESVRQRVDAAIVSLPLSAFGKRPPGPIPVASPGTTLRPGQTITSVGCAKGTWATAWKGHVLRSQGTDVVFVPSPANGRSGSALFDAGGTRIVGLVRARSMDDREGIATACRALYADVSTPPIEHNGWRPAAQCPGGQCPAPGLGLGLEIERYRQQQESPWRLSPYRHYTDRRLEGLEGQGNGGQGNTGPGPELQPPSGTPYPSLPAPGDYDVPEGRYEPRPLDTSRLEDKLGRQSQLIQEGFGRLGAILEKRLPAPVDEPSRPVVPVPPAPVVPAQPAPGPGEIARDAADAARKATEEANTAHSAKMQAVLGEVRELVQQFVGDRETLFARVEERIAKIKDQLGADAPTPDVIRAYIRDLLAEKASDGTLGAAAPAAATGLATALGWTGLPSIALLGAAWLLRRRLRRRLAKDGTVIEEEDNP